MGERNRNRAAVAAVYKASIKPVRQIIRKNCGNIPAHLIDDIAQETYARLLLHGLPAHTTNPTAYALQVALNLIRELALRSRWRRYHSHELLATLLADDSDEPEYASIADEMPAVISAAIHAKLTQRQRTVLLLHIDKGLTYEQIAQDVGLTPRIVLRDITRSYSALRNGLDPETLEPKQDAPATPGHPIPDDVEQLARDIEALTVKELKAKYSASSFTVYCWRLQIRLQHVTKSRPASGVSTIDGGKINDD